MIGPNIFISSIEKGGVGVCALSLGFSHCWLYFMVSVVESRYVVLVKVSFVYFGALRSIPFFLGFCVPL